MAPEVYYGRTELKSDVWSLGLSLIEIAEGRNPFEGCTIYAITRIVCSDVPLPSLSSEKWSAAFVDFVNKCLMRDVSERWSVKQLMEVSCFSKDSGTASLREGER